jgi:hypothetical protein
VFGDDLRLTLLNRHPIQFARVHALDAKLLRIFQVVPDFGIEKQRLGGNTAYMQAGSTEESIFFDQGGLQAKLACSDGRSVASRTAANNCDVVGRLRQNWCSPQQE